MLSVLVHAMSPRTEYIKYLIQRLPCSTTMHVARMKKHLSCAPQRSNFASLQSHNKEFKWGRWLLILETYVHKQVGIYRIDKGVENNENAKIRMLVLKILKTFYIFHFTWLAIKYRKFWLPRGFGGKVQLTPFAKFFFFFFGL